MLNRLKPPVRLTTRVPVLDEFIHEFIQDAKSRLMSPRNPLNIKPAVWELLEGRRDNAAKAHIWDTPLDHIKRGSRNAIIRYAVSVSQDACRAVYMLSSWFYPANSVSPRYR